MDSMDPSNHAGWTEAKLGRKHPPHAVGRDLRRALDIGILIALVGTCIATGVLVVLS